MFVSILYGLGATVRQTLVVSLLTVGRGVASDDSVLLRVLLQVFQHWLQLLGLCRLQLRAVP